MFHKVLSCAWGILSTDSFTARHERVACKRSPKQLPPSSGNFTDNIIYVECSSMKWPPHRFVRASARSFEGICLRFGDVPLAWAVHPCRRTSRQGSDCLSRSVVFSAAAVYGCCCFFEGFLRPSVGYASDRERWAILSLVWDEPRPSGVVQCRAVLCSPPPRLFSLCYEGRHRLLLPVFGTLYFRRQVARNAGVQEGTT